MFMSFGLPMGGVIGFNLSKEDTMEVLSNLPKEVIDVIELYDIDITNRKFMSVNSGLLQTKPILESYDLTEIDRKVLIDFAVSTTEKMFKKEKMLLKFLSTLSKGGDKTFAQELWYASYRVDCRNAELKTLRSDLENVKFKI